MGDEERHACARSTGVAIEAVKAKRPSCVQAYRVLGESHNMF